MIYLYLFGSCIAFTELLIVFDLRKDALSIIARSREALIVVTSDKLDEREKESLLRRSASQMLKVTLTFGAKFLLIVAVLFAMYWLITSIFPDLVDPILESFVSPTVIVGLIFFAMGYVWARNVIFKRL